jgi:hypothetical protein
VNHQTTYKHLWDKAREQRPGIYSRPKEPLIGRYLDAGTDMSIEAFGRFFDGFCRSYRPKKNLDVFDLHASVSDAFGEYLLCNTHLINDMMTKKNHWHLPFALSFAILIRDFLTGKRIRSAEANDIALETLETAMSRYQGGVNMDDMRKKEHLNDLAYICIGPLIRFGFFKKYGDDPRTIEAAFNSTIIDLENRFEPLGVWPYREIESWCGIPNDQLERLLQDMNDILPSAALEQTGFSCRLVAVLGSEYCYIRDSGLEDCVERYNDISVKKGVFAAVAMYPWEADHLEKARIMAKRGISVARPLGRIFAGETELGIFEWVVGDRLDHLPDLKAWRAFGKVLKRCHERGIKSDDAAGRNAIWTGRSVKLLDFEHTTLKREAKPIQKHERECSLGRVREELELRRDPELLRSFEKGYFG